MGLGKIDLVKWNRKFNNTQLKILRNVNRKNKKMPFSDKKYISKGPRNSP